MSWACNVVHGMFSANGGMLKAKGGCTGIAQAEVFWVPLPSNVTLTKLSTDQRNSPELSQFVCLWTPMLIHSLYTYTPRAGFRVINLLRAMYIAEPFQAILANMRTRLLTKRQHVTPKGMPSKCLVHD